MNNTWFDIINNAQNVVVDKCCSSISKFMDGKLRKTGTQQMTEKSHL